MLHDISMNKNRIRTQTYNKETKSRMKSMLMRFYNAQNI